MASPIPYDTSAEALLNPARHARFFAGWDPAVDNRNPDLLCAELSRLAYADRETVAAALAPIGFAVVGFLDQDDAADRSSRRGIHGFAARQVAGDLSVLVFRGTAANQFDDLVCDLDTLQSDFRGSCRVHAGFLKAYEARVRPHLETLRRQCPGPLFVTGHSLGAALATLAALEVAPAALITFGSPRVGDPRLARLFEGLTVRRFVHGCDVVARIPPEQFDREHWRQVLIELGAATPSGSPGARLAQGAADLAAGILAAAFRRVTSANRFAHVAPPCYLRADGIRADRITEDEMAADQQAARAAYRASCETGVARLRQLLASLRPRSGDPTGAGLGQGPRDLVRGLFDLIRGDPVPLRDLADHAPVNYVSAFAGRP